MRCPRCGKAHHRFLDWPGPDGARRSCAKCVARWVRRQAVLDKIKMRLNGLDLASIAQRARKAQRDARPPAA